MYGESKDEGSQTGAGRPASRAVCPDPSAEPFVEMGVSAAHILAVPNRIPANAIALIATEVAATRLLKLISSLYHSGWSGPGVPWFTLDAPLPGEDDTRALH